MRYILSILFLMYFGKLVSQSTFYYSHIKPYSNAPRTLVECEAGYLIVGEASLPGPHANGFLMLLDKQGNILWEKIILSPEPDKYEEYRTAVYHEGYFYIAGYRWLDDKRRNLFLKVNPSDGTIVLDKIIGEAPVLGGDNLILDMCLNENGFLLAGSGFNVASTDGELIQIDWEGNILWNKFYDADTGIDNLRNINLMNDGYLLTMDSQDNSWEYFFYVIKIDKYGNEAWRKEMGHYRPILGSDTVVYFLDATTYKSNHVIAHFVVDHITTQNQVLIEFDENGNEIDYRKYEEKEGFPWADIFVGNNSEIYILAQQELGPPLYTQLYAIKFDEEKEIVWEHHYGVENIVELYFCGTLTSDGGVLLGGRDQHFQLGAPYFNSIIVKTDCRGELDWSYQSCSFPDTDKPLIFPNPSTGHFSVFIPHIHEQDEVTVELHNLMGEQVGMYGFTGDELLNINVESYSAGLYTCRIFVNGTLTYVDKIVKI